MEDSVIKVRIPLPIFHSYTRHKASPMVNDSVSIIYKGKVYVWLYVIDLFKEQH